LIERAELQTERKATGIRLSILARVTDHAVGRARQIFSARNLGGILQCRWNTGGIGRMILSERDLLSGRKFHGSGTAQPQDRTHDDRENDEDRDERATRRAADLGIPDAHAHADFLPARTSRSIGRRLSAMPVAA